MSRLYCKRLLLDINSVLSKNRISSRAISTGCKLNQTTQSEQRNEQKQETGTTSTATTGSISKAMQSYLERAEEHNVFMEQEKQEFALGRRHLANMMGKDPENFTQNDINEAIRYLFPSGLFQIKARPMMKPPEELYPKQKAAQFDVNGRPHHPFFYTAKPNFFYLVHETMNKLSKLNKLAAPPAPDSNVEAHSFINGTKWMSKELLEAKLLEKLTDQQYSDWSNTMDRLADHEHFYKELEHLKAYRVPLSDQNILEGLPPVVIEADGRKCVVVENCKKKKGRGVVTVRMPGTGIWNINGQDLSFFKYVQSREMVIAPLQKANMLGQIDVEATVKHVKGHIEGETSYASLIRYGVANAIAALGAEVEPLRLAGYLTEDRRRKERNHVAHWGARAAHTWKKR